VQAAVQKREQEVSNGFRQYAYKAGEFDKVYQVLAPHMPALKAANMTELQFIHSAGDVLSKLASPNKADAWNHWIELGRAMGLTPEHYQQAKRQAQFRDPRVDQMMAVQQQQQIAQHHEMQRGVYSHIGQEFGTEQAPSQNYPHYYREVPASAGYPAGTTVRWVMGALMNAQLAKKGADGRYDLGHLYDLACQTVGLQTRQQVEQANEAARTKQARVQQARKAGASIPSGVPGVIPQPSMKGQRSVRDRLMQSIDELRA
jgi:hypothetical protein